MTLDDETAERWVEVVGFEGWYEVSDLGRIRSQSRRFIDKAGSIRNFEGSVRVPVLDKRGYLKVDLYRSGKSVTKRVHHLVLEAFVGPRPDGMEGCHGDGDRSNNRLSNLRWGTHSDNMLDKVKHGTHHMASMTHCKRGHEFTPENTYTRAGGWRRCRKCQRLTENQRRAERKERT